MGVVSSQTQTVGAIDRTSKARSLSPSPEFISTSCSLTFKRSSAFRLISFRHDSFSRGQFDPRCFYAVCRWSSSKTKRRARVGATRPCCGLPLTEENVEMILDKVRPSLMADGGNVVLHEIDSLVVVLKLQGACGSCPSSTMTLKMSIETRLRDKIPEILAVEQILVRLD